MFKPCKMEKFSVLLLNSDVQTVLDTFIEEELIEFRKVDAEKKGLLVFDISEREKFANFNLTRTRKVLNFLKAHEKEPSIKEKIKSFLSTEKIEKERYLSFSELKAEVNKFLEPLVSEVEKMESKLKDIDEKVLELSEEKEIMKAIADLGVHPSMISRYGSFETLVGQIAPEFEDELVAIVDKERDARILKIVGEERRTVLLLVSMESYDALLSKLKKIGFEQLIIPATKNKPKSFIKKIDREIKKLNDEKKNILEKCKSLNTKVSKKLLALQELLEIEKVKGKAFQLFGRTEKTTVFEVFVPSDLENKFKEKLVTATKGKCYFERELFSNEEVPVKLSNKGYFKNYEFLLKLYGLPEYNSIDPTFFIAILYPLFFGIAFSDVGYGLIFLLAAVFLRLTWGKKDQNIKQMINILIHGAIATIFFGFVFGGFFGDLGGESMKKLALVDPFGRTSTGQSYALLFLASMWAIGLLHLNLAILLGFLEDLRKKEYKMALTDKFVYFLLEIGLALYSASFLFPTVSSLQFAGLTLLSITLILLFISGGPLGFMKITGFLGNVLSYSRLMVLSISTFAIAMSINLLAELLFVVPLVGVILGAIVLVFGHLANLVFNVLASFIHPLRLHFVEFFSFFYSGKGREFKPFYFQRIFTEKKGV
ncbi:MAG: V-type ATPase 116kDa subunit family protein [Candidatus Diapherotrites archaeon]